MYTTKVVRHIFYSLRYFHRFITLKTNFVCLLQCFENQIFCKVHMLSVLSIEPCLSSQYFNV